MTHKTLPFGARMGLLSATLAGVTVVACGSGTPDAVTGEATTVGGYRVDVTARGPSAQTMSAVITDVTGAVVFTYEGIFMVDGVPAARGRLTSNGATGYHAFPQATIPSHAYFAQAAYYDYLGTSKAYANETAYDNQGCDMLPLSVSCSTSKGSCCDTHDACYAKNGCSASSWLYTGLLTALISKCAACNTAAVGCFSGGGTGPSACCAGGTCGQPWGKPGQGGQCLCQDAPNDCNSEACGGGGQDAGASGSSDAGGAGDDGGGGGDGGEYMYSAPRRSAGHHAVVLAAGETRIIPMQWEDAPGVAAAEDLAITVSGRALVQVSSVGAHPFVRAGLRLAPLAVGVSYRLVLERTTGDLRVSVETSDGATLLEALARLPAGNIPSGAPVADIVLPVAPWRAAVRAEVP